ncbi:MAG: hypothetical protein K0S68_892 [Candidatus Saccharibacteria bacterium]|nr:hypothetical protein [Candidatus Saccharibacteria bacterium]
MSSQTIDADVLERLGLLKARLVTPVVCDVNIDALEVGFVTTNEPGVVPDIKVLVGIIPGTTVVHSARILNANHDAQASWLRRSPEDIPPRWVSDIAPACITVNYAPREYSVRRKIRNWIRVHRRFYRSRPNP